MEKAIHNLWSEVKECDSIQGDLILENVFMQQTRGSMNLWRISLGVTENCLIFLRLIVGCEQCIAQNRMFDGPCILIDVAPLGSIKMTDLSRRKLRIQFPNYYVYYFKLLRSRGCGNDWTKWRSLCSITYTHGEKNSVIRKLRHFTDLGPTVQQKLKTKEFFQYLRQQKLYGNAIELDNTKFKLCDKEDRFSIVRPASQDIADDPKSILSDNSKFGKDTDLKISSRGHVPKTSHSETEFINSGCSTRKEIDNNVSGVPSKSRTISRFGNGIEERCIFRLTLTSEDTQINKENNLEISNSSNVSLQEISSKTDLSSARESTFSSESGKILEQLQATDLLNVLSEGININEDLLHFYSSNSVPYLKRWKSDISLNAKSENKNILLRYNISVPNLDEIQLHRRTNRLSYSMDFASGYPDDVGEQNSRPKFYIRGRKYPENNRIYNMDAMFGKKEALNYKLNVLRNFGNYITEEYETLNQDLNDVSDVASSTDSLDSDFLRTVSLNNAVLREMEKMYPVRYRIWKSTSLENVRDTNRLAEIKIRGIVNSDASENLQKSRTCKSEELASISKENETRDIKLLNPFLVACELTRVDKKIYSIIEDAEIVRLMLKPHTITEANCPYLCGWMLFFERIRSLIITEILNQQNVEGKACAISFFIKVASCCVQLKNNQSSHAIISGLCTPLILQLRMEWSYFTENYASEARILMTLLQRSWHSENHGNVDLGIPFMGSFIKSVTDDFPHYDELSRINMLELESRRKWMLSRWLMFPNQYTDCSGILYNFLSCMLNLIKFIIPNHIYEKIKTESQDSTPGSASILNYGHLKKIFNYMEEKRKKLCTISKRPSL